MDDQKIRLIFEILGEEGVARLKAELDALQAEGAQTATALGQAEAAAAGLGQQSAATAAQLAKVEDTTRMASGGVAGFGQAALQSGRVVQDFAQGGIGGILNNIEGLTMALGLGPGLAGAFTVLGVTALLAGPQIREFFASFGAAREADDSLEGLKKRIKELEGQPVRVAIETRELDLAREKLEALKAGLAAYDAERNKQSQAEAASGKAIEQAITESGPGAEEIEARVVAARIRALTEQSRAGGALGAIARQRTEAEARLAGAGDLADQTPEGMLAAAAEAKAARAQINASNAAFLKAQQEIEAQARGDYGTMLANVYKGHRGGQAAATEDLGEQLRGIGEVGLAAEIGARTPERITARAEYEQRVEEESAVADTEFQAGLANIKAWSAGQRKRRVAESKLGEELTKQGEHQEFLGDKEAQAQREKAQAEEQKKIERTVGAPWQRQYEMAMARNAASLAAGMGGVAPEQLGARLQAEMAARLRARHATPEAAAGAARAITGRGEEDLGRRAADASQTNLSVAGQTLAITQQLVHEYARQSGTQKELLREAKSQQQQLRSSKKTASQR